MTQSGCSGSASGDRHTDFTFTVSGTNIQMTSGPLMRLQGTVTGSMIHWGLGFDYFKEAYEEVDASGGGSFAESDAEQSCDNVAGRYISTYYNQRLTMTQSGCSGSASGDIGFSFTVSGTNIQITSGPLMGLQGTVMGSAIKWYNGVYYNAQAGFFKPSHPN